MLHIITNPQAYRALQAEIDSVPVAGSIISDEQAKNLPYLQAVIKEGARVYPAGTGVMSKVVPPEGDTVNGVFIPGGTEIGECFWGVQRNKEIYGEDAMLFRPERWLEAEGEKLEKMDKTIQLVWGHGKYQCLGKNLAFIELNKTFFEVSHFRISSRHDPWWLPL
jgi:cytochrome P450